MLRGPGRGRCFLDVCRDMKKMAIGWTYDGLREPIRFSGGLLLGEGFIEKLYVHMGFHPAWKYKTVREVIFEEGRVTEDLDRSREMKDLRARLTSEPLQPGLGDGQARIRE